jgi:predicted  nucleic acid-binding Zn-ribbon protein
MAEATTTTATTTLEELEAQHEAAASEYEELRKELAATKQRLLEANQELEQVRVRKREIGLGVSRRQPEALQELEDLRDRARLLEEQSETLSGAVEELGKLTEAASAKRDKLYKDVLRERTSSKSRVLDGIKQRMDEKAEELRELIQGEFLGAYDDYIQALNRSYTSS